MLDPLGVEAVELRDLVCRSRDQDHDPKRQWEIERLCATLDDIVGEITHLKELVALIEITPDPPPR